MIKTISIPKLKDMFNYLFIIKACRFNSMYELFNIKNNNKLLLK